MGMGPNYACLFLRLYCICSDEASFDKGASEMSTSFLNQEIPSSIVNRALNWVRHISSISALTSSLPSCNFDRVPLILTYHPTSIHPQQCSSAAQHKLEEQHLIFHLGTLQPSGLNIE
eukprot:g23019.t1